jgi:hypothetical protein
MAQVNGGERRGIIMTEETKSVVSVPDYLAFITKVMRENEEFLHENAKEAYNEVVELVNDAIDLAKQGVKEKSNYAKFSMDFFIYHILMPYSYAIYVDLLAGNLPVCFMQLRLMLESLAKCCLADSRYADQPFFQQRIELLEKKRLSTSKLMEDLGKELRVGNDFKSLWHQLSQDWVHTRGIADGVVNYVVQNSDVPPWALLIPMSYRASDLGTINKLQEQIVKFRDLLAVITATAV